MADTSAGSAGLPDRPKEGKQGKAEKQPKEKKPPKEKQVPKEKQQGKGKEQGKSKEQGNIDTKSLSVTRAEDLGLWYSEMITKAGIVSYYDVQDMYWPFLVTKLC